MKVTCIARDCAETAEGEFEALRALGWLDMPRKGKPASRHPWLCPKHAPKGSPTNFGRSTP